MVAPLSASLTAPVIGTASQGADPQEAARIKAEILSTRNELQCATCEGDKATLKEQISTLETRLRQVETTSRVAPVQAAGESADTVRSGEKGGASGVSPAGSGEGPSVVIDPQTAERARQAGRDGDGGVASLLIVASAQEGAGADSAAYGGNARRENPGAGPIAPGSLLDISI